MMSCNKYIGTSFKNFKWYDIIYEIKSNKIKFVGTVSNMVTCRLVSSLLPIFYLNFIVTCKITNN
jgi:hypothetical protein